MSRGARYSCPVHGLTDCHAMADGFYCLADGPGGPDSDEVCGKKCDFPMQMEDGRIFETRAELLAGERTDPGPGKAFPRRGRGIVVKQRPRQKAANGPPVRRGAPRPRTTNHETPARPAEAEPATAKEDAMPEETRKAVAPIKRKPGSLTCAICGKDMAGEHNRAIRCTACREAGKEFPTTTRAPEPETRLADTKPARRAAAKKPLTPIPAKSAIEVESWQMEDDYDPDIEKVAPARVVEGVSYVPPARGLLARVEALEQQLAQRDAVIAELRRVVLGESA